MPPVVVHTPVPTCSNVDNFALQRPTQAAIGHKQIPQLPILTQCRHGRTPAAPTTGARWASRCSTPNSAARQRKAEARQPVRRSETVREERAAHSVHRPQRVGTSLADWPNGQEQPNDRGARGVSRKLCQPHVLASVAFPDLESATTSGSAPHAIICDTSATERSTEQPSVGGVAALMSPLRAINNSGI